MLNRFLLGLFVALFSFSAFAGTVRSTSAGVTTYHPSTVSLDDIADATTAANGDVLNRMMDALPTRTGSTVPVEVTGRIPKSAAAAAIGRFAAKAFPVFSTASAIYDLYRELGYEFKDGNWVEPLASSGFEYQSTVNSGVSDWMPSSSAAFTQAVSRSNDYYATVYSCPPVGGRTPGQVTVAVSDVVNLKYTFTSRYCDQSYTTGSAVYTLGPISGVSTSTGGMVTRTSAVTSDKVITKEEAIQQILERDGWPTDSKLPDALREAIQSGESVDSIPQTVTGPSSSPGVQTSAPGPQPNTTIQTTTTNNYSYNNTQVTNNVTTSVRTINSTTGATISESTTDDSVPADPAPFEWLCGLPGLPPCNVKVDETGAPSVGDYSGADAALDDSVQRIEDAMTNKTQVRDLGSSFWSFVFPSGSCSPINLGFRIWQFTLDMCNFPLIGYFRAFWAWAFGVMGALYIWRSTLSAVEA